jgi:type VII secretion-associated serine protease mycosin
MNKTLLSALVIIGAAAGAVAPATDAHGPDWRPVTRGLNETPARLLPAVISPAHPVRVVSTTLDHAGRPVVTAAAATDRATAARLVTDGQRRPGAIGVELDAPVTTAGADALLGQQWDLAAMRVDGAWPRSTGAGVTVAVLDTGVDASHPDLAGHVLAGVDLVDGTEGVSNDPHGHGTHVAGTIAALTGNDEGVASVAPDARILPVRVLSASGGGYMSDVANGIVYAADHGADVINMSISSTSQVGAVTNAVAYARSRGVVVVAAAGNSRANGSPTAYPAADTGVIAVSATDSADRVAPYSNRGGYVDVAAPGSDILSTFPPALGAGYRRMNGTSMAAPHVAALAALLKGADRALSPDAVEQAITSSAVDLGVPGRDEDFGYGRVDAASALAVLAPPPAPTTEPTPPADMAPTTVPAPDPTSPEPTSPEPTSPSAEPPPGVTSPSADPTPTPPTTEPTPVPSTPVPSTPAPAPTEEVLPPVLVRAVRTGPQQLTAVVQGLDQQTVEVQRQIAGGEWETVSTYEAVLVARLNRLPLGAAYRVLVPPSAHFSGGASGAVSFYR